MKNNTNKVKKLGQIFTPVWCVNMLMDRAEYTGQAILNKTVLEPSAGDGQIVLGVMQRLIDVCKAEGLSIEETREQLKNIYAIELDPEAFHSLLKNTKNLLIDNKIPEFEMNFFNEDSLKKSFNFKFDFIIGNPPYVSFKNIEKPHREIYKNEFVTAKYNYDLYFLFFEKSVQRIKEEGTISFITPNYYKTQVGKSVLVNHLVEKEILKEIIEFNFMVFDSAEIYTSITVLKKSNHTTKYLSNNSSSFRLEWMKKINSYQEISIMNFSTSFKSDINIKRDIRIRNVDTMMTSKLIKCDSKHYFFNEHKIEKEVIKSLIYKDKLHYYIDLQDVLQVEEWEEKYPKLKSYFDFHKITDYKNVVNQTPEIEKRLLIKNFMYRDKIEMKITNKKHCLYYHRIKSSKYSSEELFNMIDENELIDYVKANTQRLSSQSFVIGSKLLKEYLNFKIEQFENNIKNANAA